MPRFLISFDDGWMNIAEPDLAAVSEDAHAVLRDAKAAGVWVTGGGLQQQRATVVDTDGSVSTGSLPETRAVLGGFAIVDVASLHEATWWAARWAAACRCRQEIREIMFDPEV